MKMLLYGEKIKLSKSFAAIHTLVKTFIFETTGKEYFLVIICKRIIKFTQVNSLTVATTVKINFIEWKLENPSLNTYCYWKSLHLRTPWKYFLSSMICTGIFELLDERSWICEHSKQSFSMSNYLQKHLKSRLWRIRPMWRTVKRFSGRKKHFLTHVRVRSCTWEQRLKAFSCNEHFKK